jgi:radical SAM superfamily enzyme YgiQ (UPF0313 family)
MKIILAKPPVINERDEIENCCPNLEILYLISYLRKKFDNIEIYYLERFLNIKQHQKKLHQINPNIYGIFFTITAADDAYQTINLVRNEFPSLPIICGGQHPTSIPAEVLTNSGTDICVIGEVEETFAELVEYYSGSNIKINDILGIAYRKNDKIIRTPPRPLIKDLDTIPYPAWDYATLKKYPGLTRLKGWPYMPMMVSRGCPYNCTFCLNSVWKVNKPWLRLRTPKNIAVEVEYLHNNLGIREIHLNCDEFNSVPKWSIKVCKEIKKLGFDDLYFNTNLRADKVSDDLAKSLSDIKCGLVSMGIESGNQRTLDGINKKITLGQVVDSCKTLKKYDIKIFGFFMIFNIWEESGKLCYETPEECITTLNFAHTLLSKKLIDFMSWGFTVPLPGALLYEICQRHNLIDPKKQINKWGSVPVKLPGIEERDMQRIKRRGMLLQVRYGILRGIKYTNWRRWRYYLSKVGYTLNFPCSRYDHGIPRYKRFLRHPRVKHFFRK